MVVSRISIKVASATSTAISHGLAPALPRPNPPPLIGNFLVHVETARQNGARSRNTRLAAIRSFFRYVAFERARPPAALSAHPEYPRQALRQTNGNLP